MDRRQRKTRDSIFRAFNALIDSHDYSRITVQDIIEVADIGRTTFYAHFETKDALLEAMCADLLNHIQETTKINSNQSNRAKSLTVVTAEISHMLYHFQDNHINIKGILRSDGREMFERSFRAYLDTYFTVNIIDASFKNYQNIPRDFLISHITNSFIGLIQWWSSHDHGETPEQLTDIFMKIINLQQ